MPAPSRTATLYRVAYRRADRAAAKGYTYKVFKGEHQARSFIDRLSSPPSEATPEKFRELAPLAELHLHVGLVKWEPVEASASNDLLDHSEVVWVGGDYVSLDAARDRLLFLNTQLTDERVLRDASKAQLETWAVEAQELNEALEAKS
jgi:hypothetical protein